MSGQNNREFDVVIQGATGFTGLLVAEYLLRQYGLGDNLRWAIAGRDEQKLHAAKKSLGDSAANLPIIVADSFDQPALDKLASRTRVVISTVGPYALYGSDLVAACVVAGTHYCDLAGEVQWIRKMIDRHQQAARQSGARIVHCCGFDSVPMDIGVWHLQHEAKKRTGGHCRSISMMVKATKGTASGGTLASMMNIIEESQRDRNIARILVHPYSLNPEGEREGPDRRDQANIRFRQVANAWTAPFVMAGVNTKVVRRSNALADYPYSKDFRYDESISTGPGFKGWLRSASVVLGLGMLMLFARFSLTRRFLQRFILAKPGEGPDRELQQNGFFDLRQFGVLDDGQVIKGRVTGDQDPGYGSTSKMLGECGVCLAKDDIVVDGGVWTPAAAMAEPLIVRLRENAGLSFEILD